MELTKEMLTCLKNAAPGCFAIYRIAEGRLETLHASPRLPALNGMTREEYDALTHDSARVCGELDGCPVLLVICVNASAEPDIYQTLPDRSVSMVCVCDRDT